MSMTVAGRVNARCTGLHRAGVFNLEQCGSPAVARLRSHDAVSQASAPDSRRVSPLRLAECTRHVRANPDAVLLLSGVPAPLGHGAIGSSGSKHLGTPAYTENALLRFCAEPYDRGSGG